MERFFEAYPAFGTYIVPAIVAIVWVILWIWEAKSRTQATIDQKMVWRLSLLGAMLAIVVSLAFDTRVEVAAQMDDLESLMGQSTLTAEILQAQDRLSQIEHPLPENIFRLRYADFRDVIRRAGRGEIHMTPLDLSQEAVELIASAKDEILATSYVKPTEWWKSPWGQAYLDANYRFVDQGHKIVRIFILESDEDFAIQSEIMHEMHSNGVTVRLARRADVGNLSKDVILIDGEVAGELELDTQRQIVAAKFFTDRARIAATKREFERLEQLSHPLEANR